MTPSETPEDSPRNAMKAQPKVCSARIDGGRVVCDCLKDNLGIRADISICHPTMVALLEQAPIQVSEKP